MHTSLSVLLLLLVMLAACGGDEDSNSKSNSNTVSTSACSLDMPLEGAAAETLSWGQSNGCGGATSGGLVTLTFGVFGDESVNIGFIGFMFGETGPADAYVRYDNGNGAEWTAQDCSTDITRNEVVDTDPDFGDTYMLVGTGSCPEPAGVTAGGGDAELIIGDFEFSNDSVPGPR